MAPALIRIKDEASGRVWGPSSFLPQHVLEVADAANVNRMITEMVGWEARFIEQEFDDILFPRLGVVEGLDPGQLYVGYQQRTKTGQAEWLSRRASNFPTIGAGSTPHFQPSIPLGVAYDINLFEQAVAGKFGVNLDSQSMMDCAEYIDQKLEEAWHYGGVGPDNLAIDGMFQLFNGGADAQLNAGTSIPKVALTAGNAGNTWDLKTGDEIADDIAAGVAAVKLRSRNKRRVKKVLWGLNVGAIVAKKRVTTENNGTQKLMDYLRDTYRDVEFVEDPYMDDIDLTNDHETFTGGSSVLFYDDAPTNFKFRANRRDVVRPYEPAKGFQLVKVNCYGLCAGIQAFNNYFGAYMKDVLSA